MLEGIIFVIGVISALAALQRDTDALRDSYEDNATEDSEVYHETD